MESTIRAGQDKTHNTTSKHSIHMPSSILCYQCGPGFHRRLHCRRLRSVCECFPLIRPRAPDPTAIVDSITCTYFGWKWPLVSFFDLEANCTPWSRLQIRSLPFVVWSRLQHSKCPLAVLASRRPPPPFFLLPISGRSPSSLLWYTNTRVSDHSAPRRPGSSMFHRHAATERPRPRRRDLYWIGRYRGLTDHNNTDGDS